MDYETKKSIAVVVGVILLIIAFVWVLSYRHTQAVTLDGRAWIYEVKVQYDVETTSTTCRTDSSGQYVCETSTDSTTYTRCSAKNVDYQLPIVIPVPTCNRYWGDYESETVYYVVQYHDDNQNYGQAFFPEGLWNELENGLVVKLTTNLFNQITNIEAR